MDILRDINKKLKAILFDFNGVILYDSEIQEKSWQLIIYEKTGKKYNINELRKLIHGRGVKDLIKTLIDDKLDEEKIKQIAKRKENIYRDLCLRNKDAFTLTHSVVGLFERLNKYNIPYTIASSASEDDMRFYFEHLKLNKWFSWDKIAYFDGKVKTKPAPDLYILGAKKLNFEPCDCCVIEDAVAGMQAAKNANAGFVVAVSIERELPIEAKELANSVVYSLDEINELFLYKYFISKNDVNFPLYYISGMGY
jgi:beta-phosphoglucomutase-like phosphatase (HAD superfamily)